jgi:4-carboxymuconolactone decarboxylase
LPEPRAGAESEPAVAARAVEAKQTPLDAARDLRLEQGMQIRRAVLGDAHVDRAAANTTDFDRDFQEYITRSAWGEIWARPGLPRPTRHLVTIAMLAVLDRQEELAMHLKATRNTGVSLEEVKEVLMHVAVYAGVPAANAAIKTAKSVLFSSDASPLDPEP